MQLLAYLTATAALASLAAATPLTRRQGVTCVPKYTGALRNTYRSDLAAGSNVVVSPNSADGTMITVDGGKEAGSMFTFVKCSYVRGWGDAPEEYGVVQLHDDKTKCITAAGNGIMDGANELRMMPCSSDTDEQNFARQYFYADWFSKDGVATVTLDLTGGPDGQYKLPSVGIVEKDNSLVTTVNPSGTSFKVLALADVQILS